MVVVVVELDVVVVIKEFGTQLLTCVADINGTPSGSAIPTKVTDVGVIKYISLPLLVDIMFYSVHKLLHNKYLFYFHKRHHELVHPVGIGSFYMSLLEFYGAIVIPVFGPLILLGANNYNAHLWLTFSVFNGICVAHGNTRNLSEFHDYHHNNFRYNFGIDIFMDNLFNTKYYNKN